MTVVLLNRVFLHSYPSGLDMGGRKLLNFSASNCRWPWRLGYWCTCWDVTFEDSFTDVDQGCEVIEFLASDPWDLKTAYLMSQIFECMSLIQYGKSSDPT